MINNTIINFA